VVGAEEYSFGMVGGGAVSSRTRKVGMARHDLSTASAVSGARDTSSAAPRTDPRKAQKIRSVSDHVPGV
jgi:hypothetical protein